MAAQLLSPRWGRNSAACPAPSIGCANVAELGIGISASRVAERRRRWGGDWEEALADVPTGDLKVTAEVTKRIGHLLEHR